MVPRPVRNHNPGDLRFNAHIPWTGLAEPPQDAAGYCVFIQDFYGYRALARDLHSAWAEGYDTIAALVPHFAPAADDNDVEAYTKAIEQRMGLARTALLVLSDPAQLASAVHAFTHAEYAQTVTDTDDLVSRAVAAALIPKKGNTP